MQKHLPPIDRRKLVERHHVVLEGADTGIALCVGNGEFAFSADITGLQTFPERWSVALSTLAQWAWHNEPNPAGYTLDDAMQEHRIGGGPVRLPSAGWPADADHPAAAWLERNPHKINLARVGLHLRHADGRRAALEDLRASRQELRLWDGSLHSRFEFDGQPIEIVTRVHPRLDLLAISLQCPPALAGRIGVGVFLAQWMHAAGPGSSPYAHGPDEVTSLRTERGRVEWQRSVDATTYHVAAESEQPLRCEPALEGAWTLWPADASPAFELRIAFSREAAPPQLPSLQVTRRAVDEHWHAHWRRSAAIDLSACTDPRAGELERRVVLSQYLMAVHASGSLPPQETGLSELSWHGKFHLEMHVWHAAHFALWGCPDLLERSMAWYVAHLPQARERAQSLGLAGARWPKMVGPEGRESPGAINPFIVWQQPHPIYLAELLWRAAPSDEARGELLQRYAAMVSDSADCLASLARRNAVTGRYDIGPPVVPVQEIYPAAETSNPAFELAYFHFGLHTAQFWRERAGLPRRAMWDEVAHGLAELPQRNGLYVGTESHADLWARADCSECRDTGEPLALGDLLHNRCPNVDHPSFVGAMGWLPGAKADANMMRRTLFNVRDRWNLSKVWGWDFGMLAMTAARVGEPELALDFLLHPSLANQYGKDGHVRWKSIGAYLPANGALLTAVAMMAAGWDGAPPAQQSPGFPRDGRWAIRTEGLLPLP